METKKNSELQLERNSNLYFTIGLAAILALIYLALEWKSYDDSQIQIGALYIPDDLGEEVPITVQELPPPPPKIKTPAIIEIATNEEDIIETIVESNEPNQDTEIVTVKDIDVDEYNGPEEIPWVLVEDAPIFPGCENETDKKVCFQEMMQKHIRKNFQYPDMAREMGLQGRVNVLFTIKTDGSIGDIRMRGPHKILEGEAKRIISKLPQMTPGKQRDTPVKVPFAIPITFKLQ